jgi:hypothetical protein
MKMNRNGILPILLLAILVLAPGCASIVSKSTYPVTIQSSPEGAEVTVSNRHGQVYATGVTPLHVYLKSSVGFFQKADYLLKIRKPGYKEMTLPLNSTIDGWYFGNILFGGLIGMLIVDPATGAMWRLETDYVQVNLTPDDQAELVILDVNEISDEMKAKMIPIRPALR